MTKSDEWGLEEPGDGPICVPPKLPESESTARQMLQMVWGGVQQVALSLPPVAAGRAVYHNAQLGRSAVGHAVDGDWDLAAAALLEIPQQTAEAAGSIITGPIEAAMALPGTINTAMNAPDPEVQGAAAVAAAQQAATVIAAVVGAAAAGKGARASTGGKSGAAPGGGAGGKPAAKRVEIQPNKGHRMKEPMSEAEAIDHVRQAGDVVARDKSTAKRIAEHAGEGAPFHDSPHGPGQLPHFHPRGPNGERAPGHVLY